MTISWQDIVNGGFEFVGAVGTWLNVMTIVKHKQVLGINIAVAMFFWTWGVWNCYYYPHLGQWASFAGGVILCGGNFVWCALAVKYQRNGVIKGPL
jgi:hypothetical protein